MPYTVSEKKKNIERAAMFYVKVERENRGDAWFQAVKALAKDRAGGNTQQFLELFLLEVYYYDVNMYNYCWGWAMYQVE